MINQSQDSLAIEFEKCRENSQRELASLGKSVKELVMSVKELAEDRNEDRRTIAQICERTEKNQEAIEYMMSRFKASIPILAFIVGAFAKDILNPQIIQSLFSALL